MVQLNDNPQPAIGVSQNQVRNPSDAELRAWADRLNVTKVQLKAAINAVGPAVAAVEAYLNRKK